MADKSYTSVGGIRSGRSAGAWVEIVRRKKIAAYGSAIFDDNRDNVNARIKEIEEYAYSAGFLCEIKGVTCGPDEFVILYELETDPGFREPM